MKLSSTNQERWENLQKTHIDKRRIFSLNPQTGELTEIDPRHFYTTGKGYPIKIGEKIQLRHGTYEIQQLQVIRYAGLIASYTLDGECKKVDVGRMIWNEELQCWTHNPSSEHFQK